MANKKDDDVSAKEVVNLKNLGMMQIYQNEIKKFLPSPSNPSLLSFNLGGGGGGYMAIPTEFGFLEGSSEQIKTRYHELKELVQEQEDNEQNDPFNTQLYLDSNKIVNGYHLKRQRMILDKDNYQKFVDLWLFDKYDGEDGEDVEDGQNETQANNFKSFYYQCDEIMCTEWAKMDEFGESFAGFWKYPEMSDERINCWDWTQRKNILALYRLPYPTSLLLKSIEVGCGNRAESVPFSNFFCHYIAEKYISLNPLETLPMREVKFPIDFNEDDYIKNGYPAEAAEDHDSTDSSDSVNNA